MGQADYLKLGDWNAVCSMCGGTFKASQLKKHWQGQYRCEKCWEPRHPQDFVRAVKDDTSIPWSQPDNGDFIDPYERTGSGETSYADWAVADDASPDSDFS